MSRSRTEKLVGNTALIAVGQFGSKVLSYILTRVHTDHLTQAQYSLANNITELASLLIPLISLGFGEAIFRLAKGGEFKRKEVFSDAFAVWGMGSLLIAAIAPILWMIPYFKNYILLLLIYSMASIFHTICTNYIRSKGAIMLYAVQGILNAALVLGLTFLFLVPLNMTIAGFVLAVPLADLIVTFFIIAKEKLWRDFSVKEIHSPAIRKMLRYSVPLIPTTVFIWIINISDRLMVTYFCGDAVNGLLSAAHKIPTLLGVMNSIFIYAWQISAMDEKDSADKRTYYTGVFRSYSSVLYVLAGGIILFCRVITFLLVNEKYYDAWIFIPILTTAMVLHNLASYMDSDNMVRMKSLPTMFTALTGAMVNVVLNVVLIQYFASINPLYGGIGAAIATFFSYLVTFIIRAIIVRKSITVKILPTVLNILILCAMTGITMAAWPIWWILSDLLLLAVLTLLNWRPLFTMIKSLFVGALKLVKVRR